jgi:hypothetical protein
VQHAPEEVGDVAVHRVAEEPMCVAGGETLELVTYAGPPTGRDARVDRPAKMGYPRSLPR